ncbi:MAG: hypothetical protein IPP88_22600 [Betaproteobacteria bacterium]|nr:hypothetical protein [Betaproteobacteria bacterium]
MAVLADAEIQRLAEANNLIFPFEKELLQGASYDMRLGAQYVKAGRTKHMQSEEPSIEVAPGEFVLISTFEKLDLPLDLIGHNGLMSPWAKRGLVCLFSPQIDPGFKGILVVPVFNAGDSSLNLRLGEPIFTIEFVKTSIPASFGWAERHGSQSVMSSVIQPPTTSKANFDDIKQLGFEVSTLARRVEKMQSQQEILAGHITGLDRQSTAALTYRNLVIAVFALVIAIVFSEPISMLWKKYITVQQDQNSTTGPKAAPVDSETKNGTSRATGPPPNEARCLCFRS